MKGMVFTMLNDLVEDKFGIEVWDELIDTTQPPSGGVYTSVDTYPDAELLAYVQALSDKTGVAAPDLVRAFGHYVLGKFAEMHPEFFEGHDLKSFLKSVHDVIHVEVKKLHPDAILPEFTYDDPAPDRLVMNYHSPRKLCALAEGLITGASEKFGETVRLDHSTCVHTGADRCVLSLNFGAASEDVAA